MEARDPVLRIAPLRQMGRWWAGSADPATPLVSPIYADLRGLPPIQLYIGTDDLFLPDARRLGELVAAAGGQVHIDETRGGFHGFVAATYTPEAKRVYREIAERLGSPP